MFAALFTVGVAHAEIQDVRVGGGDGQITLELVCDDACTVTRQDGRADVLFVRGARLSYTADFTPKGADSGDGLRRIEVTPVAGGARVAVTAGQPIASADIAMTPAKSGKGATARITFALAGADGRALALRDDEPRSGAQVDSAPGAPVRVAESADRADRIEAPTRLAVPAPTPTPEPKLKPAPKPKSKAPAAAPVLASYGSLSPMLTAGEISRRRAEDVFARTFDADTCAAAAARVAKDAWNLDALADVGVCKASNDKVIEADRVFRRLLALEPDSAPALIGLGLVAEASGEISVARKYYQDAIDAGAPRATAQRLKDAIATL